MDFTSARTSWTLHLLGLLGLVHLSGLPGLLHMLGLLGLLHILGVFGLLYLADSLGLGSVRTLSPIKACLMGCLLFYDRGRVKVTRPLGRVPQGSPGSFWRFHARIFIKHNYVFTIVHIERNAFFTLLRVSSHQGWSI